MYSKQWAVRAASAGAGACLVSTTLAMPAVAEPSAESAMTAARTAAKTVIALVRGANIETPKHVEGERIRDDGGVPAQLLNHYYGRSGRDVVIDWSFFAKDQGFMEFARSLPVDRTEHAYSAVLDKNGAEMVLALNNFAVTRTSQNCYAVRDYYDFEANSRFAALKQDAQDGKAKEFTIRASGCEL